MPCLKSGNVPNDEGFSARQGNLTRQSLVDCRENERGMVGKGPPFWHVDIFKHVPGAKKEQDLFPSKVLSISGGKALKFSFPFRRCESKEAQFPALCDRLYLDIPAHIR